MPPPSPAKPRSPERQRAERAGRRGEALAALWLGLSFYRVIARRYRTPVGEIDLVLARFGEIVFVEVKARGSLAGERAALEAVDRRRLARAAEHFVSRHPRLAGRPMRFDVIFLAPWSLPRHFRNAFDATGSLLR
jgi:putative endonuclease